jgi:Glutathionylspermidine synthase preATP-grasp
MDDARGIRSFAARLGDAICRAALEDGSIQQGNSSAALGNVSDHPNLLPAYFSDDPKAATLGASYVRKPLYSREGAGVALAAQYRDQGLNLLSEFAHHLEGTGQKSVDGRARPNAVGALPCPVYRHQRDIRHSYPSDYTVGSQTYQVRGLSTLPIWATFGTTAVSATANSDSFVPATNRNFSRSRPASALAFEWLRHGYGDDLMAMAAMFVVVGVAAVYGVTGL